MNRMILKIKFLSDKSFEITLIYVDSRLISKGHGDFVYFHNDNLDFLLYSRRKMIHGNNMFRLPDEKNYQKNMSDVFEFDNEYNMREWLRKLYHTLNDCNNMFAPFKDDISYSTRLEKTQLNGEYWIV
mgnify:CR=1 FL=1